MGLYRVQLKSGFRPRLEQAMKSIGMPIVRIEEKGDHAHFFYIDPKKSTECSFWVATEGDGAFWYCGLSSSSAKLLNAFDMADIFEKK